MGGAGWELMGEQILERVGGKGRKAGRGTLGNRSGEGEGGIQAVNQ